MADLNRYPAKKLIETGGPTVLLVDTIPNGKLLKRVGANIEGVDPAGSSPLTDKGDLMVNNGTVDARLAVGADSAVLIADSAQSLGMRWGSLNTAMALVESPRIISGGAVTDVTFSGLNGDVDGQYVMYIHIKNPTGGVVNYYLRPNNLENSDMSYLGASASGASMGSGGTSGKMYIGSCQNGDEAFFELRFEADKSGGLKRMGVTRGVRIISSSLSEMELSNIVWKDTTTLITSLVIHADAASAIGNGSTFVLYKLQGNSVVPAPPTTIDHDVADIRMRLDADPTVQSKTTFEVVGRDGKYIRVNGELVNCWDVARVCNVGDNLITNTGADAGVTPSNDTTYWAYISNSQATFGAGSVRLCATAPTTNNTGKKYLGTTGNAQNWRFIGWVRPTGGHFVKSQKKCFLVNWFNPLPFSLISIPGYSSSVESTYAAPSGSTANPFNGGTDARCEWLNNPEATVSYCFELTVDIAAGKNLYFGVAENSGSDLGPVVMAQEANHGCSDGKEIKNNSAVSMRLSATVSEAPQVYEGYSFVTMMGCAPGGGVTVVANTNPFGSVDPISPTAVSTYIRCTVLA